MSRQFTLTRGEVIATDPAELKARIILATGSEVEAESVLRSLARLGSDPSIERYQMTQVLGRASHFGATRNSWRLRAERVQAPDADADSP